MPSSLAVQNTITNPDHVPVLLNEVIKGLSLQEGGLYVDGTFGAGGYSVAMLKATDCNVIAIDRDPEALERGREIVNAFEGRLKLLQGRFGDLDQLLEQEGVKSVDGIVLDLGISSMQVDDRARGFSFLRDGPLDMRMEKAGMSAADAVNTLSESDLANIIRRYGEEKHALRVARAIVKIRKIRPFMRTIHLADTIRSEVRRSRAGIDPATRTFQALRIYINDELGELERGLKGAEKVLVNKGRLVAVSFHSLEDRIVKTFLRNKSDRAPSPSRHQPINNLKNDISFKMVNMRALTPSRREVLGNPRSRSARLRIAEKISDQDNI